ncbi:hypothetical protein CDAR_192501 [Caerostris darwini]|uniref:Uncharacterized protein n=1 Tax=Caerostris darwini TaxID=1538125 RepID=A0AAV4W7J7_9ARAC|nr:hypothetical protein CDAR_192501 [Caerostris darwini]
MHPSVLVTRAHAEQPMQKHRRATKAEFHPSPGSERSDLRSLRRCVSTTNHRGCICQSLRIELTRNGPRGITAERQKQNSTPLSDQNAVTCDPCGDVSRQIVAP